MIKKVVNRPESLEFDIGKIYVTKQFGTNIKGGITTLVKFEENCFAWQDLASNICETFSSFEKAIEGVRSIYIMDNQQQFADFINGETDFSKVKLLKILKDDEVSIDDVNDDGIYGIKDNCILSKEDNNTYSFHFIGNVSRNFHATNSDTIKGCILKAMGMNTPVYSFDTVDEFLEWTYKQWTGKELEIKKVEVRQKGMEKAIQKIKELFKEEDNNCNKICSKLGIQWSNVECYSDDIHCNTESCFEAILKEAQREGIDILE